jgi:prolyl 4-hydroxylase
LLPLPESSTHSYTPTTSYKEDQRDAIQILHYGQNDRYIVHTDWFTAGGYEGWNTSVIGNTNRYATVFFYLNDVQSGGHTVFPKATVSG